MYLLGLSNIGDLETVDAEVMILGNFIIDDRLILGDGLNFYMGSGASISVDEGSLFRKIGGFISACFDSWESIRSHGGRIYFYNVDVSGANTAFNLGEGTTGNIQYCEILDCNNGIIMRGADNFEILECRMECSYTAISAEKGTTYLATRNTIGQSVSPYYFGVFENGANSVLDDNRIFATYGIGSYYSSSELFYNEINVESPYYGLYTAGILGYSTSMVASDNSIFGYGQHEGIRLSSNSDDNDINNNLISGDFSYSVSLGGSNDQNISDNNIQGSSESGIYAQSADGNIFRCNEILAGDYGLHLSSGSNDCDISSNVFNGASTDFYTRSEIGFQEFKCNTGWDYVIADGIDVIDNKFIVTNILDIGGTVPASFEPDRLFEEKTGDESCCTSNPGPRSTPYEGSLCEYINYLNSKKTDFNNDLFWIRSYHFARRFLLNVPEEQWPDCFKSFWNSIEKCGLKQLVQSDVEYRLLKESVNLRVNEALLDYESRLNQTEEQRESIAIQLKQIREETQAELSLLREEQALQLNSVECTEQIFILWREIYLINLKFQAEKLNESEENSLRSVSALCPTEYGDVVYWASGILRAISRDIPNLVYDCSETLEQRTDSGKKANNGIRVYPNPSNDFIFIDGVEEGYEISLIKASGHFVVRTKVIDVQTKLDVSDLTKGIYFVRIVKNSEDVELQKVVIF